MRFTLISTVKRTHVNKLMRYTHTFDMVHITRKSEKFSDLVKAFYRMRKKVK